MSASGLPFVFPICFCFSAPTAPCWPFPFPLGIVALEELRTLCGEEGGLFSLLLVWPLACLSFSLFLRCSCILRLLSSLWMKFVLPWERGSAKKGKMTALFCIIHLTSESTSWKNHQNQRNFPVSCQSESTGILEFGVSWNWIFLGLSPVSCSRSCFTAAFTLLQTHLQNLANLGPKLNFSNTVWMLFYPRVSQNT